MPIARFQMQDGRVARFEVPEGTSPDQATQMMQAHFSQPSAQPQHDQSKIYSGDMQSGAMTALQGAGLGFMDELAGVGGAIAGQAFNLAGFGDNKSFAEDYRTIRDQYRGDVGRFAKENPKSALALQITGSIPTAIGAAPISMLKTAPLAVRAGVTGATYGGLSGVGSSESEGASDLLKAGLKSAAIGGALGAVSQPVMGAIGAVGKNVGQRFSNKYANEAARIKLAEALSRDVRGAADPYAQASARITKLGHEATIADAGGESTRALLDTLATLPGKTKDAVANLIHQRQATRASRMFSGADEALGTKGANAGAFTKELITKRSLEAKPLYDAVRNAPVGVDDELAGLLASTKPFHAEAERLAMMKGTPMNIEKIVTGDQVPLQHLDILKQTLYDVADAAKRGGQKQLGAAADDLRIRLTQKLDDAAPKDVNGESLYKKARDIFAGHSETLSAVEAGKSALREGAESIQDLTANMGKAEIDAFRIGVLQSLREKLGGQSGQTQIMKMWREPNTSERLQAIFGNDYRKFASDVAREARLQRLEGVGKGSQTAARQFAAGDLDKVPAGEIGQALANAKVGNIAGLIQSASKAWNQVQMPERTRNELSSLLMKKGDLGKNEINTLSALLRDIEGKKASRAGSIAAELGYQANR